MIYIKNEVNHPSINQAAMLFMRHYGETEFLDIVKNVNSFNHTRDSGKDVAFHLEDAVLEVTIKGYRTINPWSKVVAYAQGSTIFINTRTMNVSVVDRCETIMHECLHLLGYSHDGNRVTKYNLDTVPYKVGMMFGRYVSGKL